MSRTLFALALLLGAGPALAAPLNLSNMGFLADANGDGLTGDYELAFSLYDDADATNPALWTETHTVTFADGSYSVILGTSVAIDEALLDQYPLFLGLSVDGAAEMVPRHEVVSVPYSILSETSFNVDGGTVKATSIEGDTVTADAVVIGKTTIDGSGIHVDGSTVIDTSGGFVGESPAPPDLGCELGQTMKWSVDGWGCGSDDDSFAGADASAIESSDIANWNAAYDWTDHSDEGYLTVSDFAAVGRLSDSDSDAEAWEGQIHFVLADPLDPPQTPLSQSLLDELVKLEQTGGEVDPQFLAWGEGLDLEDPAALENHVKRWNRAYDEWDANSSTWDRAASFASGANRPTNGSISQADVAGWKALAQEFGPYDVDGLPYVASETDPEFSSFQTSGGEVNGPIDMGTNEITDLSVGTWNGAVQTLQDWDDKVDLNETSDVTFGGSLSFGAQTRQMLNLWGTGYGIGVENATLYSRSDFGFAWYQGGTHVPGGELSTGTELMALTSDGLRIGGQKVTGPKIALWDAAASSASEPWKEATCLAGTGPSGIYAEAWGYDTLVASGSGDATGITYFVDGVVVGRVPGMRAYQMLVAEADGTVSHAATYDTWGSEADAQQLNTDLQNYCDCEGPGPTIGRVVVVSTFDEPSVRSDIVNPGMVACGAGVSWAPGNRSSFLAKSVCTDTGIQYEQQYDVTGGELTLNDLDEGACELGSLMPRSIHVARGYGRYDLANTNATVVLEDTERTFEVPLGESRLVGFAYAISGFIGSANGGNAHVSAAVYLNGQRLTETIGIVGNTNYFTLNGSAERVLGSGTYTVDVRYRTPASGAYIPSQYWAQRSLTLKAQ